MSGDRRWLGHGTMAILTVHGCGFYAMWLWDHEWLRGLVWDRNGTNMLAGKRGGAPACLLHYQPAVPVVYPKTYSAHELHFLASIAVS